MTTIEKSPLRQVGTKRGSKKAKRAWRIKVGITWRAVKKALTSTMMLRLSCASGTQKTTRKPIGHVTRKKSKSHPAYPLAHFLEIPTRPSDFIDYGDHMTPTISPRENISKMWKELHGLSNWENLLDPLHPCLRREVVKYGEFSEATYDAFDFDPLSEYCGSCRYNKHKLFEELNLTKHGYKVTKYIYAMSQVDVPRWFDRSQTGSVWSKDSNWMGYVAVSNDEESKRIGRRDIVMAWRGTIAPTEWLCDLRTKLEPIGGNKVKVQEGFHSIYTSKSEYTRYNKQSASEQVMKEVKRLVKLYRERGEEVSFTITGHSLGGAVALLNAYEAATTIAGIYISVISFGAPRVGNGAFKNKLTELGVKTLRVVVSQDVVPKLPGIIVNKVLHKLHVITPKLNWVYRHVGTLLKLDYYRSPYLKHELDILASHNLEIYLHLLDGYICKKSKFRWNARRDIALVNKSTNNLIEELRIPEYWYQLPYKGLVLNKHGRWVKPGRAPEDIPSPYIDFSAQH